MRTGPPSAGPLTAHVVLAGAPRRFALSLVQGFVVEPLASLAAVRAGQVLLPAAALGEADGAVVLLGRSRSGKTSLVARAVAEGRPAWGDDQVLLDARGSLRPWPRRLRVYPDLRSTAPRAVAALPRRVRARLQGLAGLRVVSRGWVAPSLPLTWSDLGGAPAPAPVAVRRLVVLERGGDGPQVQVSDLDVGDVAALAGEVLREQRSRFRELVGAPWDPVLTQAEEAEAGVLDSALRGVPAERWVVPDVWSAPTAVAALAHRLGVHG